MNGPSTWVVESLASMVDSLAFSCNWSSNETVYLSSFKVPDHKKKSRDALGMILPLIG